MLHFMLYLFSVSGICVMESIFSLEFLRQQLLLSKWSTEIAGPEIYLLQRSSAF